MNVLICSVLTYIEDYNVRVCKTGADANKLKFQMKF